MADRAWSRPSFVARPISRPWYGKLQPVLIINSTRLLIAAGSNIYSYKFSSTPGSLDAPSVYFEASYAVGARVPGISRDVTGLAFIPDGAAERTVIVGFDDGSMEHILLPLPTKQRQDLITIQPAENPHHIHLGDTISCLSSAGDMVLSLSSSGVAALTKTSNASSISHAIDLQARGWSSYLSTRSSSPYVALGTSSPKAPLTVHSITHSALASNPFAILKPSRKHASERSPAVYGISVAPPSSPWGGSDQVLVSGWYDGIVRVHDLRSSIRDLSTHMSTGHAPLLPVLSLNDAWSLEPIYAVSCGGGSSSHIAAGSARHSVVAFWDVRSPSQGWSVHAPGNDPSPVYSIHLESSRLFGATQSRPFVYDFGPGVTHTTYPHIPPALRGDDGLKPKRKDSLSYYVTQYHHARSA